jgi:hypothetical protein
MILSRTIFLSKKVGGLSKKIFSTLSIIKERGDTSDFEVPYHPWVDSLPLILGNLFILENDDSFVFENGDYFELKFE